MLIRKIFLLFLQIFGWLVTLCLERSVGLPIMSTLLLLIFISQFNKGLPTALLGIVGGLIYAAIFGLPLYVGTFLMGGASCGFIYVSDYFSNQNRRLLLTDLIVCLLLWWWIKLPVNFGNLIYNLTMLLLAVVGVYLTSGWKLRWRTLQISRRFQPLRS